MGFSSRGITSADILSAIVDDATRFSGASIAAILADTAAIDGKYSYEVVDFWSAPTAPFNVTGALTDITLEDVDTLTIIQDPLVARAWAMIRIPWIKDDSTADNALNIASVIQVDRAAGGWVTGIEIPANSLEVLGSAISPCGIVFIGDINISTKVTLGQTTNFRWYQARATASNLIVGGLQAGVKVLVAR